MKLLNKATGLGSSAKGSLALFSVVVFIILVVLLTQRLQNLDFLLHQYLIWASTPLGFSFPTFIKWASEGFPGLCFQVKGTGVSLPENGACSFTHLLES